jgi:hypothetical protein
VADQKEIANVSYAEIRIGQELEELLRILEWWGDDKGPMGGATTIMLELVNRETINRDAARMGTSIN